MQDFDFLKISDHITSWQIDGEAMKTVTDFILGGSKITAGGECSHEIIRGLLLGNPFQCSCLENTRDRGAWWAAVYGIAESDTTETT